MLRKTLLSTAALGAFVALAFGSAGGESDFDFGDLDDASGSTTAASSGGGSDNEAACRAYVDHQNGLDCMPAKLNADQMCGNLGMNPQNMVPFYNCMKNNAKCNGDLPDLAGQADCQSKL